MVLSSMDRNILYDKFLYDKYTVERYHSVEILPLYRRSIDSEKRTLAMIIPTIYRRKNYRISIIQKFIIKNISWFYRRWTEIFCTINFCMINRRSNDTLPSKFYRSIGVPSILKSGHSR